MAWPWESTLKIEAAPTIATPAAAPQPIPAPAPAGGVRLLDLSTRASLLGVEVIGYNFQNAQQLLTIDGLWRGCFSPSGNRVPSFVCEGSY